MSNHHLTFPSCFFSLSFPKYYMLRPALPTQSRTLAIEDNDGPYYWHIKSGTIQREPPLWPKNESKANELKTPMGFVNPKSPFSAQNTTASAKITSTASTTNNTNPLMQLFGSKGDMTDLRGNSSNRLQVDIYLLSSKIHCNCDSVL